MLQSEIAQLEKERTAITEKMGGNLAFDELQKLSERINVINELLDEKEMRWLELSELG